MAHIALILGANPTKAKSGPRVKLESGKWRIVTQGVSNSTFTIASTSFTDLKTINLRPMQNDMIIDAGYHILNFADRGNEKAISVYAIPI